GERRASGVARRRHRAALRLDHALGHVEPEPDLVAHGPFHALLPRRIERPGKDVSLDGRTAVGHARSDHRADAIDADAHRPARARRANRGVEQRLDDLGDALRIARGEQAGHLFLLDDDAAFARERLERRARGLDELAHVLRLALDREPTSVDARDVDQVADDALDAVDGAFAERRRARHDRLELVTESLRHDL